MGRLTKALVAFGALLVLIGVVWSLKPNTPKTADEQIRLALADAQDAARRGNVGELMDLVSGDFKSGLLNKDRLRLVLNRSKASSRGVDYDVRMNAPQILPARADKPDERVVMGRFAVFDAMGGDTYWKADSLTLVMRRETRRHNLIFSEPRWRVVSVANLPPLPGLDGEM
jgi:hypothetical protein